MRFNQKRCCLFRLPKQKLAEYYFIQRNRMILLLVIGIDHNIVKVDTLNAKAPSARRAFSIVIVAVIALRERNANHKLFLFFEDG